jgi:hypothetical protein
MTLTSVEKTAGRWFSDKAKNALAVALADFPDSAPCSGLAKFYRHECPKQEGRTRSIQLTPVSLRSPEIWVAWVSQSPVIPGVPTGSWSVISREEAEDLVAAGDPVEVEQVLAGKFNFTWKRGQCPKCKLMVLSREGILRDSRPGKAQPPGDLAAFSQRPEYRVTQAARREHE